jgi:hypothetical protein
LITLAQNTHRIYYMKEGYIMKKFTTRYYNSKEQLNKASSKLKKRGFTVLEVTEESGKQIVKYQTRP